MILHVLSEPNNWSECGKGGVHNQLPKAIDIYEDHGVVSLMQKRSCDLLAACKVAKGGVHGLLEGTLISEGHGAQV